MSMPVPRPIGTRRIDRIVGGQRRTCAVPTMHVAEGGGHASLCPPYRRRIAANIGAIARWHGPALDAAPSRWGPSTKTSIQLRLHAALDSGARHQGVVPALHIGEVRQIHLVAGVAPGPAENGEIGDRQLRSE